MSDADAGESSRRTPVASQPNPVLDGGNRFKLGVFGANLTAGNALTMVPERLELDWPLNVRLAQAADRAGIEAFVPVARWRGLGGRTNPWGESFESYTWAAGLAALTERITVFATSHVMTVHPVMAAKQLTTIDWISGGRVGLNVVAGWFVDELAMFGVADMDHDERYAYAAEWIDVVKALWSREDEFDVSGGFFEIKGAYQQPKPLRKPGPPIMNAGFSPAGHRLAAEHSDIAFIALHSEDVNSIRAKVDSVRALAKDGFDRDVQVWSAAYVVCRDSEEEARRYVTRYADEMADRGAVEKQARLIFGNSQVPAEERERMLTHLAAGLGGYPLVGTPEQIVDRLSGLSAAGLAGLCLSWVDFENEVPQWIEQVMPLMENAGLREPVQTDGAPSGHDPSSDSPGVPG
jgi:alkanesulfonate monooxygenase SsuD/methylene tetrahydromethanopterin reductase-like flavin-dependent oxidoreductase (luciferase family)